MQSTVPMKQRFLFGILTVFAVSVLHAQSSENPLDGYSGYTNSFFLPYSNDPGFGSTNPSDPTVSLSIGDFNSPFTPLDTGSRGLFFSADLLGTNLSTNDQSYAGQIYLNSSGRIYEGDWTTTTVDFSVTNQQTGLLTNTSAAIPVLDVETLSCSTNPAPGESVASTTFSISTNAPKDGILTLTDGTNISYTNRMFTLLGGQSISYSNNPVLGSVENFGVGFDRTGNGTAPLSNNTNQIYNAFLNLATMRNGSMEAGYILKTNGVQLGLTETTTNFAYTQLLPTGLTNDPSLHTTPDWQAPTGQVVYNGQTNPTGQVVIDIGIGSSILTLPTMTNGNLSNPPLSINLINSGGAVGYNITTNSDNLLNPQFDKDSSNNVQLFPPLAGNYSENQSPSNNYFFNTGRDVLNGFDFLYDGQNGYVGLITNGLADGNSNVSFTSGFYPNPVPEPSTWSLVASAIGSLILLTLHRRNRKLQRFPQQRASSRS